MRDRAMKWDSGKHPGTMCDFNLSEWLLLKIKG